MEMKGKINVGTDRVGTSGRTNDAGSEGSLDWGNSVVRFD